MGEQLDSIGRRNRLKPSTTGKRVSPTERDLLWFTKIHEHGPLPSTYLLEYTHGSHKSEKRAKERLTDLFNEANTPHGGPYLTRPMQQFQTIDARYKPLVYDLAPAAIHALAEQNLLHGRTAHQGPWWHALMTSCITSSIELNCLARKDMNYIPQSAILARADTELRWPTCIADPVSGRSYTKDLLPDGVFGLEYVTKDGPRYRFYALEADRATEPLRSGNFHRKSFIRHLLQYQDYIERGGYRKHLKLTASMLVLNVTPNEARKTRMMEITMEHFPHGCNYQLFQGSQPNSNTGWLPDLSI
ncbi:replication-relaxation family protein [Parasphingorhabdus sp.]|uniref:replication-relaxation family protein n=1 Tax=Parasphingorhabdus sp. TaxID=2709688 RepID=UPI003A945EAA